jgi:hypothetical protein
VTECIAICDTDDLKNFLSVLFHSSELWYDGFFFGLGQEGQVVTAFFFSAVVVLSSFLELRAPFRQFLLPVNMLLLTSNDEKRVYCTSLPP